MRSGTKTEPETGIITKTRNGSGIRKKTDIETANERGRKSGTDIETETRTENLVPQNTRKRRRSCHQLRRITRRIASCTVFVKHPMMNQSKYCSEPLTNPMWNTCDICCHLLLNGSHTFSTSTTSLFSFFSIMARKIRSFCVILMQKTIKCHDVLVISATV